MNKRPLLAIVLAAGLLFGLANSASASGGGAVRVNGSCTGSSTIKLKAKARDAALETEFEVDSNRNGQTWNVRLDQNGTTVFSGSRTTGPPSGSFGVSRILTDNAGTDRLVAVATNARSGERCRAVLSI